MDCTLRKWEESDALRLLSIYTEAVRIPYMGRLLLTPMDARKYIRRYLDYAITVDGIVVGNIGIRNGKINWFLAEEYWGNGIVRKAAETLLSGYRGTIRADVLESNERCQRTLARLGFTEEKRKDGLIIYKREL